VLAATAAVTAAAAAVQSPLYTFITVSVYSAVLPLQLMLAQRALVTAHHHTHTYLCFAAVAEVIWHLQQSHQ
jgi:hypothetical protein